MGRQSTASDNVPNFICRPKFIFYSILIKGVSANFKAGMVGQSFEYEFFTKE